nr:MAG TPA: hypothetical protein [Caudoviricetes sp.]
MFILNACPAYGAARPPKQRLPWWAMVLRFRHEKNTP